jgi:hypothetical protein
MTVEELAATILYQRRKVIAAQYSQWQADAERVEVRPGPKYTKIDRGPEHNMSGFLMIENATGDIYGIKAYGKVHKGHYYGTLGTADQWYWGEYGPQKARERELARLPGARPCGRASGWPNCRTPHRCACSPCTTRISRARITQRPTPGASRARAYCAAISAVRNGSRGLAS